GEGLAPDDLARQTAGFADGADLVLEKFAQRFEELHLHALGQAADVVVALDQGGRVVADGHALDHVGIERALGEVVGVTDGLEGFFEHFDEGVADDLALFLGVGDALETAQEELRRVNDTQIDLEVPRVERLDLFAFAGAEQAVVNEDAGELLADGLVDERGGHGGIDSAGKAEEHAGFFAHGLADVGDRVSDEVLGRPVLSGAADALQEVANDIDAALAVKHLGMKLDAVEVALAILDDREGRVVGGADRGEARGQREDR